MQVQLVLRPEHEAVRSDNKPDALCCASQLWAGSQIDKCKGKGKGHPRTGHEGPEGGVDV